MKDVLVDVETARDFSIVCENVRGT